MKKKKVHQYDMNSDRVLCGHVQVGLRVWWNDPEPDPRQPHKGLCSGPGNIVKVNDDGEGVDGDTVLTVAKDDGGEVETTIGELEPCYSVPPETSSGRRAQAGGKARRR